MAPRLLPHYLLGFLSRVLCLGFAHVVQSKNANSALSTLIKLQKVFKNSIPGLQALEAGPYSINCAGADLAASVQAGFLFLCRHYYTLYIYIRYMSLILKLQRQVRELVMWAMSSVVSVAMQLCVMHERG